MQQQLLPGIASLPEPTLDNFVAGRNRELVTTLRSLTTGRSQERFFYLWGEEGSGKSHLLKAVADAIQRQGTQAVYTHIPTECDGFQMVALDNVDCLDEAAQIDLFNLYNRLRDGDGFLLAGGTLPPAQLALRSDLTTRLAWGLVFRVQALDDDEKTIALAAHAEERGFTLPADVSSYLLHHCRRDLPSLMAVLEDIDHYSLERQRPVSTPLLRELMEKNRGRYTG